MKQIDFDVRVWNLTPAGAEDGTQTRADMLKFMKENYPMSDGWRVESVTPAGIHGGAISLVVYVARYADDMVSAKSK